VCRETDGPIRQPSGLGMLSFKGLTGPPNFKDGQTMMDRESIRISLLAYLEDDLGETIPSLDDEINIREGLGLDSVDVVGLVMQVERQFRIRLATEELSEIVNVGDLLNLLQAKISSQSETETPDETTTRDAA
jgi:acyl carrier protein